MKIFPLVSLVFTNTRWLGLDAIQKTRIFWLNHIVLVFSFGMDAFWTVLSENSDPDGVRFISTLEAKDYPFYAIQVDIPLSWLSYLNKLILNRNSCSTILRRAATHGLTNLASKSSTRKRWDIKKPIVIKAFNIKQNQQNPLHSIRTSNQRISCTLWIILCMNGKVINGHHNMKRTHHSSKIFCRPPTQLSTSPSSSPLLRVKASTSSPPGRQKRPHLSTTMMSSSQVGTSLGQVPHLTCLHLLQYASKWVRDPGLSFLG